MVVRRRQQATWLPGGPRGIVVSAGALVAALLAGCGDSGTNHADELAILADRAERLAVHLEEGDGCAAELEGDELRSRTRDALAAERITQPVAAEILGVVDEVTSAASCDEQPTEGAEDDEEEEPEAEEPEAEEPEEEEEPEKEDADKETPPGRSEEGPPGQREGSGRGKGNA